MQAHTRSVLLVHPDAHRRTALARAFHGSKILSAASRAGAVSQLAETSLEFVLAHHGEARALMRDLDRAQLASPRLLLGSLSDPDSVEAMADMAAEGLQFYTLDDDLPPALLERQARALLNARRSGRARVESATTATFTAAGTRFELICLDLGNKGLSVLMDSRSKVECLLPGTPVSDLQVRGPLREILRSASGRVRHLLKMRDGAQDLFRVGIEIVGAGADRTGERVADPIRVLALIRRALRRGEPLHVQLQDTDDRHVVSRTARLLPGAAGASTSHLFIPDGANLETDAGDVVKLSFELGGHNYSGLSTVVSRSEDGLRLHLPRSLKAHHRRSYLRLPPGSATGYGISFRSASSGEIVQHPLLELHPYGFSFRYDAAQEVLPPGLVFDELKLVLPDGSTEACEGEVRDIQPLAEWSHLEAPQRCGAMLHSLNTRARDAIIDTQLTARFPSLSNGAHAPFADVWKVIRDAGHYYPDYPLEEGPHLATLERTHDLLARAGLSLSRTLLHRDESGAPKAHVGGLRVYSKTWFIHHLAVSPGYHRGDQLSRLFSSLAVDHVEHLDDVDFVRLVWRKENRWPDRIFGSMSRAMQSGGMSVVRRYHYARLPLTDDAPASPARGAGVKLARRMRRDDELWLEAHFRSRGELLRLRADDLGADEMELASAGRRFASHGLTRGRTGFVVDGPKGPLAFALAENATSGLDWPEITNAFSLIVPDADHPDADSARRALIHRCIEHYRELERPSAVCVADVSDLPALEQCGFRADAGEVAEWTFHRQAARTSHDLLQLFFERLTRPARSRPAEGG